MLSFFMSGSKYSFEMEHTVLFYLWSNLRTIDNAVIVSIVTALLLIKPGISVI